MQYAVVVFSDAYLSASDDDSGHMSQQKERADTHEMRPLKERPLKERADTHEMRPRSRQVSKLMKKTKNVFTRNRIIDSDSDRCDTVDYGRHADDSESDSDSESENDAVDDSHHSDESKRKQPPRRRAGVRVKWTDSELQMLRICFSQYFRLRKPPINASIDEAKQRFPNLCKRTTEQIKSRAWHLIKTGC